MIEGIGIDINGKRKIRIIDTEDMNEYETEIYWLWTERNKLFRQLFITQETLINVKNDLDTIKSETIRAEIDLCLATCNDIDNGE